jgi:hypothetical protein
VILFAAIFTHLLGRLLGKFEPVLCGCRVWRELLVLGLSSYLKMVGPGQSLISGD